MGFGYSVLWSFLFFPQELFWTLFSDLLHFWFLKVSLVSLKILVSIAVLFSTFILATFITLKEFNHSICTMGFKRKRPLVSLSLILRFCVLNFIYHFVHFESLLTQISTQGYDFILLLLCHHFRSSGVFCCVQSDRPSFDLLFSDLLWA